jgi:pimeloyl-ACP methyl ester carboxylesterase
VKNSGNAKILLIPNAGHATFVDQTADVLQAVHMFLTGTWPAHAEEIAK